MRALLPALILALWLLPSCKKDDCTPPPFGSNIVGTWRVDGGSSMVEFKSDGTLLDPSDALITSEANGMTLDQKKWSLLPGDYLLLRAENGMTYVSSEFTVAENDCDHIGLEVFFVTVDLDRI